MSTYQPGADLDDERPHLDFFESGDGIPSRTVLARREVLEDHEFDERFEVREDPHLWARVLEEDDVDVEKINEALATKRRRDGSITADPDRCYRYELLEISDLAARSDEFADHFEARRAATHYRHGRRLLSEGDSPGARKHLLEAVVAGHRDAKAFVLLGVACLPAGQQWAKQVLDQARGWIHARR